ncbi:phage holin family protein [Streptomyces sp. NPDC050145]|uniref:phage holin family protein n=1 Tax=Streptomyces sp. NPDC050145 TaxID=3365602 RepID=UPI0037BD7810
MKSAPHLLAEDRQTYERILDEVLLNASDRPELASLGQRLNPGQLRTMALNATALITAAAALEYDHYVRVREQNRDRVFQDESSDTAYAPSNLASAPASSVRPAAADRRPRAGLGRRLTQTILGTRQSGGPRAGDGVAPQRWAGMSYGRRLLAAVIGLRVRPEAPTTAGAQPRHTTARPPVLRTRRTHREARSEGNPEEKGAGLLAVMLVLAPLLTGCVAVIFFLVGLLMMLLNPAPAIAEHLVVAGWVFTALTGAGILVAVAGLVVTALRNDPTSLQASAHGNADEAVEEAREAWVTALRERGIMPFFTEALEDPPAYIGPRRNGQEDSAGRMPQLGYHRPGFSSPDSPDNPTGQRPSFSSPDFSSPDYEGTEHQPE